MIKKIKRNFIWIIMTILIVVFTTVCTSVIVVIFVNNNVELSTTLNKLIEKEMTTNPVKPEPPHISHINEFRSFVIKFSSDGDMLDAKYDDKFFSEEDILVYIEKINLNNRKGRVGDISYITSTKNNVKFLAGIDRSIENNLFLQTVFSIIGSAVIALLLLSFIVWKLSNWLIKPINDAFKRQKEFISDASHELKTPLTIISANTDILKNDFKNNKWIDNIKSQTDRMNTLVNDMLQLAKIEEQDNIISKSNFNISNCINNATLAFDALVYESGKTLNVNIESDLLCSGDENSLKKIINMLIDNSIKYSDEKGLITVNLKKHEKYIFLEVTNTCTQVKDFNKEKIFERFYRGDSSRSRETGGSGLGLAIIKSICEKNKWRLNVDYKDNKLFIFTIIIC